MIRSMKWLRNPKLYLPTGALLLLYLAWQYMPMPVTGQWSEAELALLESLHIENLGPLPPDPGNAVADDPRAAELGHQLFFDTRLSSTGEVSCATCHQPEHAFTDQLPLAEGVAVGNRNSMGLVGVAYSPWFFWDGRKDSLWSQALEPLENPAEHNTDRISVLHVVYNEPRYRKQYESLFGALPALKDRQRFPASGSPQHGDHRMQEAWYAMSVEDRHAASQAFANLGKALSAYQRKLMPGAAALDEYLSLALEDGGKLQDGGLGRREVAGLELFIGRASCIDCHNGPLLSNNAFHNTGVLPPPGQLPSQGRAFGLRVARDDPFNCQGAFSDSEPEDCLELRFARGGGDFVGAQRTPSLRNVGLTAPYMHAGQIGTLVEVVRHYDTAGVAVVGHNEVEALGLRAVERRQLEAFLRSLDAPLATDTRWLQTPE